jgi:hypothetical protein
MATIIQYRPSYFSGYENAINEFNSLDELLNIEWVDAFKRLPNDQISPSFHQFSINKWSDQNDHKYVLIAEYKEGFEWWVVGYIDDNEIIKELPIWKAKYEKHAQ